MATTRYVWDYANDSYLMEKDEVGVAKAVYTNDLMSLGSIVSERRDNVTSFYHFDGKHSTTRLTNGAQLVTDEYTYSAYGETTASAGQTVNPFAFLGSLAYYSDPTLDSIYAMRGFYAPSNGRWLLLQSKPTSAEGSNRYAFPPKHLNSLSVFRTGAVNVAALRPTFRRLAISTFYFQLFCRRRRWRPFRRRRCPPPVPSFPSESVLVPPTEEMDCPALPDLEAFACGLHWEHLSDLLMLNNNWAPAFGHCYAHCKIAQNCGENAQQVSTAVGLYTETYQSVICQYLISQVGVYLACLTGVCKSAWQDSDFEDNQTGFDLGWQSRTGKCEAMCKEELDFIMKGDPGSEEGKDTPRPYGRFCQQETVIR